MKAKDLIRILQAVDPKSNVDVEVERCDEARLNAAKYMCKNKNGQILCQMEIDGAAIELGIQEKGMVSCILYTAINE